MSRQHILLTVLGTQPRSTRYHWKGHHAQASLAPLALLELLAASQQPGPTHLIALCTPEAKAEAWPLLQEGLRKAPGLDATAIELPSVPEDLNAFVTIVAEAIPSQPPAELTVDATHGPRHLAFLTYLAALYLSALRGTPLRGAWYGLLQGAEGRFVDLRPLLELPQWIHAVRVFTETGSATPLADLLGDGPKARPLAEALRALSLAHGTGLPLELGRLAADFPHQHARPLQRLLAQEHGLPLAPELTALLTGTLEAFQLPGERPKEGWKKQVALTEEELRRQARLIDDLFACGHLATALGLMREWTVSWAILRLGLPGLWVDHAQVRRRAESALGGLAVRLKEPGLGEEQRRLATFWKEVSALRNAFLHAGMRPQVLAGPRTESARKLQALQEYWSQVLRHVPALALTPAPAQERRLLVSPLGLKAGVLFSALRACEPAPEACLVICSREAEALLPGAVARAGFQGTVEPLVLEDPFGGLEEIQRLVKASRPRLLQAERVWVNITGGTTVMGLAVEAIAQEARSMARATRRFGLIDRRPAAEQEAEPFQAGEVLWLDAEGEAHGEAD